MKFSIKNISLIISANISTNPLKYKLMALNYSPMGFVKIAFVTADLNLISCTLKLKLLNFLNFKKHLNFYDCVCKSTLTMFHSKYDFLTLLAIGFDSKYERLNCIILNGKSTDEISHQNRSLHLMGF